MLAGSLLRVVALQQPTHLRFAVAPVSPERPDGRQLAGLRPPRHCLGVDAEHGGHLGRGQERFGVGRPCGHGDSLRVVAIAMAVQHTCYTPQSEVCILYTF